MKINQKNKKIIIAVILGAVVFGVVLPSTTLAAKEGDTCTIVGEKISENETNLICVLDQVTGKKIYAKDTGGPPLTQSVQIICQGFGADCLVGCKKLDGTRVDSVTPGTACKVGDRQGICTQPNKGTGRFPCFEKQNDGTVVRTNPDNSTSTVPTSSYTPQKVDSGDSWLAKLLLGFLFKGVNFILGIASYVVYFVVGSILQVAAWIFEGVINSVSFATFTESQIVQAGWGITRDIANMFFVMAMMIMAFSTILQIGSYNWKRVLPNLLIAALLINFSLVIAGVIIDFSQVLTKYFFNASTGQDMVSVKIADALNLNWQAMKNSPTQVADLAMGTVNAILLFLPKLVIDILLFLFLALIFLAAAFFLIVRTIALWFLLILAPLAWAFFILPGTKKYWDMWWQSFGKWVIFAPAYAFLFYIAMKVIESPAFLADAGLKQPPGSNFTNVGKFLNLHFFMNYIVVFGLLYGSLMIAQKTGVVGAKAAISIAKGAGKGIGRNVARWAAKGAPMSPVLKMADKIPLLKRLNLGAKFEERQKKREQAKADAAERGEKYRPSLFEHVSGAKKFIAPLLVPEVWKRGLAASRARADSVAYSAAQGKFEDLWDNKAKILKLEQPEKFYETIRYQSEVAKRQSEFSQVIKDEDQAVHYYQTATDPVEKEALLRFVTSINGINTLFAKEGKEFDPLEFRKYIQSNFGDERGARVYSDLAAIASGNGNYSLVGGTEWDKIGKKIQFVQDGMIGGTMVAADEKHMNNALTKSLEIESQKWATSVHPDSFFKRDLEGRLTINLNAFGEKFLQNITGGHVKQVDRLQGRTLTALYNARSEIRAVAGTTGLTPDQVNLINDFATAVENRYLNKDTKS